MRYLFLLLFPFLFSSCFYVNGKMVRGNGHLSTQHREVGTITGVNSKGSIDVYITQSDKSSVRIEGDENLLPLIEINNNGGVLEINTRRGYSFNTSQDLKVYVSAPSFTRVQLTGSGNITSKTKISNTSKMQIQVGGSGDVILDVDSPAIDADIAGSGSITLRGTTQNFDSNIRGSGDIRCFDLLSENSNVDIAGSGGAQVFASKQLMIDIKGSGDVQYKGNPSLNQKIHGSGGVSKVG